MTQAEKDEAEQLINQQNEEYFRITFIYFVLCILIILCFSLGLPKKCRKKLVQYFPNLEHWLETEDERKIRLEQENNAERERRQEEERKEQERRRVINDATNN